MQCDRANNFVLGAIASQRVKALESPSGLREYSAASADTHAYAFCPHGSDHHHEPIRVSIYAEYMQLHVGYYAQVRHRAPLCPLVSQGRRAGSSGSRSLPACRVGPDRQSVG